MNAVKQIKRVVALFLIVGVMPLCASENKQNRRSTRLREMQRLVKEQNLEKDAMSRQEKLERERREQTVLSYDNNDDSLENLMFRPICAEEFRRIVEESKYRGY